MAALAEELSRRGLLDDAARRWADQRSEAAGGSLDTALLELELVDEEELLAALEACHGLPGARWHELGEPEAGLGEGLPEGFSRTFGICPWKLEGETLVALVQAPLPADWLQELRDLFGLEVDARIAPAHAVSLHRSRVYGTAAEPRAAALEARLAERRRADVRAAASAVGEAPSLRAAVEVVLDFAATLLEAAGFALCLEGELYVAAGRGLREGALIETPAQGATVRAALLHQGFFAGPVAGTAADRAFFEALGRPLPRAAVVVPVPSAGEPPALFLADNGARGIPTRRVAELTLLVSRLGRHGAHWARLRGVTGDAAGDAAAATSVHAAAAETPAATGLGPAVEAAALEVAATEAVAPAPLLERTLDPAATPASAPAPAEDPIEREVLARLRRAAADAGQALGPFVDLLLAPRAAPPPEPSQEGALVGEMRGLFERLARDIPAELARGMETAFRDMVPRIASAPAPRPLRGPGEPDDPTAPRPAAGLEMVQAEAAPREVPSYRSRRAKAPRRKL